MSRRKLQTASWVSVTSLTCVVLVLALSQTAAAVSWEGDVDPTSVGYTLSGDNIFTINSPPGETTANSTLGHGTYDLSTGLLDSTKGWQVHANITDASHTGGGNHKSAYLDIEDETGGISLKFFGNAINVSSDDHGTYGDLWNGLSCCNGADGGANTGPPHEVLITRDAGSDVISVLIDNLTTFGPYPADKGIGVAGGTQTLRFGGTNSGGAGATSTWDFIRVIPEPSTLVMLGLGCLGLTTFMRRRRS